MLAAGMSYNVRQLAGLAGVSVRTLHYYDQIGLLKPTGRNPSGYRQYGEDAIVPLQQVMFFRELGFSLDEIKDIMSRPDFSVLEALESHRTLLTRKAERLAELLLTVERTIRQLKEGADMQISDYYQGFSDEKVQEYREEVRRRWGEDTLRDSEGRVAQMGKARFTALQAEGGTIFQCIADNMSLGFDSPEVQEQVARWRQWLEHFSTYSDEAVVGLGRMYSEDPRFAAYFKRFGDDLPSFLTKAIEHYYARQAAGD
jgi:DNA-binding transcriptional MerR regulator